MATSTWVSADLSVDLTAVGQTGYDFLGWNGTGAGNYSGASLLQAIIMSGPISELATFQLHVTPPAPTFTITFKVAVSFAPGTEWGVTLGGVGYSSTGTSLVVSGLVASSYTLTVPTALSPDGLTRYSSFGSPPSVTVSHDASVSLSFSTSYWVSVEGTPGGTVSPVSGWVTSGGSILLNATPADGFDFAGWAGTGPASFSGAAQSTTIIVSSPITEVATFEPVAHTVSTTSASSIWSAPTTWLGLGLVGLLVGLVVGLIARRGGGRPPAPAPYAPPTASSEDPASVEGGNV